MNLDWRPQYTKTRETIKEMGTNMARSYATTYQKMRTLKSCIRNKVEYAFCVAPYTKSQLSTFDSILCRAAKEAYRLPKSVSTAAAHEDTSKGGLGCPSLLANYNAIQTQRLVAALNDRGPLGQLTRARLTIDKKCTDKITAAAIPALAQHSLRLRQQIAAASTDIEIWKDGKMELSPQEASELLLDAKKAKLIHTDSRPATAAAIGPTPSPTFPWLLKSGIFPPIDFLQKRRFPRVFSFPLRLSTERPTIPSLKATIFSA